MRKKFFVLLVAGFTVPLMVILYASYFNALTGFRKHKPRPGLENKVTKDRLHRVKNLRKTCEKFEGVMDSMAKIDKEKFGNIIVNDKHKILYCYVPKVASTNFKRLFLLMTGKLRVSNPLAIKSDDVHHKYNDYLSFLSDFSLPQIKQRIKTYRKFMFVREPLERLLSAYRNKLEGNSSYFHLKIGRKIIQKYRQKPTSVSLAKGNDVKFSEFIQFVTDPEMPSYLRFNEHWAQLYGLCHPCLIKYDFIGKYETFNQDLTYILKNLSLDKLLKFPERNATYKLQKTNEILYKYYKNIPPASLTKLWKVYYPDYVLFDYDFPKVLMNLLSPEGLSWH